MFLSMTGLTASNMLYAVVLQYSTLLPLLSSTFAGQMCAKVKELQLRETSLP